MNRRDLLRFGAVSLAAPVFSASAETLGTGFGRAKACILLYMDGGPSHIDLWDMKPDAPAEIRGEFKPITSSLPGVFVCEHLPRMARRLHLVTQIRSVVHGETVHDPAVYQMLTGRKHLSSAGGLTVQSDDFPQIGSAFGRVDARPAASPKVVELPETMKMEGRILPGQNSGFLGRSFDPFRVEVTQSGAVVPPELGERIPIREFRLSARRRLLDELDRRRTEIEADDAFGSYRDQALRLLSRPTIREAFDLELEHPAVLARYGSHRHGRSVLLARRLVEAGSRFVTVYWGRSEQDWADGKGPRFANNPWDTHRNHFPLTKDQLAPPADQALAALLDDLVERGLFEETLVVWMGDFGRMPRITTKWASRDHWPSANTVLLAGAGVPSGAVIGRSDSTAAEVTDSPVSPADLSATVFYLLGVRPGTPIEDARGRRLPISTGVPIRSVVG